MSLSLLQMKLVVKLRVKEVYLSLFSVCGGALAVPYTICRAREYFKLLQVYSGRVWAFA